MPNKLRTSLVIAPDDYERLRQALLTPDGLENFATVLCGTTRLSGIRVLLVREIVVPPREAYLERSAYNLRIAPSFFNSIVNRSLKHRLNPVIIHSHPGPRAAIYSPSDDAGERRLLTALHQLISGLVAASLLVTDVQMTGRVLRDNEFEPMSQVWIRGYRHDAQPSESDEAVSTSEFDRQVRAIGARGQKRIQMLRVGVVGVGGTGSAVAEEVVRLGVSDVILIDPESFEVSNLSRVWGSTKRDLGRSQPKVAIVRRHLNSIRSGLKITNVPDSVLRESVLIRLADRDVVFSCTDNLLSRAILNRFAHQYLVPVVDMGLRLDAREGRVTAAAGRVTIVGPGFACLRCSNHLSPERLFAESLPKEERTKLADEGYIQGIDVPAPSVISLSSTIASLAVTGALSLYVNLTGGEPPVDQIYDATRGTMFTVAPRHDDECDVCGADGLRGLGDLQPVSTYE
jgi:molybdopterin-synthase adenylyltransferase